MNNAKKVTILLLSLILTVTFATIASAQYDWGTTSADEAAWMFGLGTTMCCAIFLIPFIIWIVLGIWVYKDAEKRGKSGILWFIIILILGIVGLIIWLVVRPPIGGEKAAASDRKCPNCGRPIPMYARACPYCAKNFEE